MRAEDESQSEFAAHSVKCHASRDRCANGRALAFDRTIPLWLSEVTYGKCST